MALRRRPALGVIFSIVALAVSLGLWFESSSRSPCDSRLYPYLDQKVWLLLSLALVVVVSAIALLPRERRWHRWVLVCGALVTIAAHGLWLLRYTDLGVFVWGHKYWLEVALDRSGEESRCAVDRVAESSHYGVRQVLTAMHEEPSAQKRRRLLSALVASPSVDPRMKAALVEQIQRLESAGTDGVR
jgi:hypothetical protein